jgi:hypothetical protein
MPRNRGGSPRIPVYIYGVVAALAVKRAAMLLQIPDEIGAFQAAGRIRVSRITWAPSRDCSHSSRFASKTMVTNSSRFAARLFKSIPLRVRARQFFNERDIAVAHLHV